MSKPAVSSRFSYFLVNKTSVFAPALLLLCALSACSSVTSEAEYKDKQRDDMYKNGSLVRDEGGFSLLGGNEKKTDQTGLGVNGFLWRASLDTVSFMPIASADPFGGTIITDWYSSPETPDERVKLNIFILDRELRADGVKVNVFRQTRDGKGNWSDAAVNAVTGSQLEDAILTRARQLKLAQKEAK